jgi:hypothetical protein
MRYLAHQPKPPMLDRIDRFGRRNIHWISLLFIALVLCMTAKNERRWTYSFVAQWDAYGYTMFNSALLLHKDFRHPTYLDTLDAQYHPASPGYGRHKLANGNTVFKYTCGNALMTFPFYYTGHCLAKSKGWPVDGMSLPYQASLVAASLFWGILGLYFVARTLRQWYPPGVTAITLLLVGLGTNYLYYAAIESGFTHPLNFFWFAFGTWALTRWLRDGRWRDAALLGLACGFIALVRATDLVFGVFVAVLLVARWMQLSAVPDRRRLLMQALLVVGIMIALFSIQMGYWKWATGHWLFDSYRGEYFNFAQPHILDGLFSYRKGWFVYTPLALFATLGIVVLWRRDRALGLALAAFWLLNVYVVFSWVEWWYGGGFGARAMAQSMAVLSLPLAALVNALRARLRTRPFLALFPCSIAAFLVLLQVFQTFQYAHGILHWDRMSKDTYWKTFGKTSITPEEFKTLYGE